MILQSRDVQNHKDTYPHDAGHVFKNNADVDEHNNRYLTTLTTSHHKIPAKDFKKGKHTQMIEYQGKLKASEAGGLSE